MNYRIISTLDGSVTNCSLSELSRKLKPNCILAELNEQCSVSDSWPLTHKTIVFFAVEFADYALKNYTQKKLPEAETCIALTRKWLENTDSVSNEELRAAAYAAHAAAYAAADAAHAAAYAAAYAAHAAYYADGGKSKEAEYVRQGHFIVEYLRAAATLSCSTNAA